MSSIIAAYDKTLFYNEAGKYCVLRLKTADPMVPEDARDKYRFADHLIRFVAVGYDLPRTDAIKMELDGAWVSGKYGPQFQVDSWHELVPSTIEGVLGYLSSGLLKGIGPKTAMKIYEHFGPDGAALLRKSFYQLCQIPGFGFKRVDAIVVKSGVNLQDPMRVRVTVLTPAQFFQMAGE